MLIKISLGMFTHEQFSHEYSFAKLSYWLASNPEKEVQRNLCYNTNNGCTQGYLIQVSQPV